MFASQSFLLGIIIDNFARHNVMKYSIHILTYKQNIYKNRPLRDKRLLMHFKRIQSIFNGMTPLFIQYQGRRKTFHSILHPEYI